MFDAGTVAAALILDRGPFHASLDAARAEAADGVSVPVSFDLSQASAAKAIAAVKSAFAGSAAGVPVMFSISAASVSRAVVSARAAFKANPITVPVTVSISNASVLRAVASARAVFKANPVVIPVVFGPSPAGGSPVKAAGGGTAPSGGGTAAAAAAGVAAAKGFQGGWMSILGKPIALFGGVFGTNHLTGEIPLWHLLVDWVIEFSAVLIPATIALGAFGVAAFTTAKSIFTNFMNIRTIVQATGKSFGIVSGGVSAVQAEVKPEVFQLWGDAITLATQKGGGFQTLAVATGHALDQLAARMTVAITTTKGVGGIMATGAADVSKLGTVVGNLGGVLGNVLRAVPGFADVFLNLWVAVSKGAEVLTSLTVPLLNVVLWAHGLILYAGLAVTGLMKIVPAVIAAGGAVADFAFAAAASIGVFILDLAAADTAVAAFAVINDALTPWGWVAIGVTALAGLVLWLTHVKSATQQWVASQQAVIDNAPTVAAGIRDTAAASAATAVQVTAASAAVTAAQKNVQVSVLNVGRAARDGYGMFTVGVNTAKEKVATLTAFQETLTAAQNLSNTRLAVLTKTYGSQHTAMGLLNAAGITEKQWQDKSAAGWANIQQQVMGTMLGYQQMGVRGGALGNDLQVMNRQVTAQYQAMTKLNGSLDTWVKDITGTQDKFDAFGQGLITLATDQKAAGATMDGLGASSLTLNAAFGAQVTATNAMIDTWRLAGVASGLQNKGIKASIALLVPYAKGSKEATAQLAALAEEAGYNGPASMKRLDAWLGNTHGALRAVKDIANQATIQEALLTSAMKNQGSYISGVLLKDISNAELAYGNVTKLAGAYGTTVAKFGAQSAPAQAALHALDLQYISNAKHVGDTTLQIAEMITKLNDIPLKKAIQIVVAAEGTFKVTEGTVVAPGGVRIQGGPKATGGLITGPGTGTSDTAGLFALSNTEFVQPAAAVSHYGVPFMEAVRHKRIPKMAGGGLAGTFSGSPSGVGSFDLREYAATQSLMEAADAAAAAAAMRKAIASALASMQGGLGTATGGPSAIMRYAESFVGTPYVWGGTTPNGWDCSGFTSWVYHHFGIPAPRTSQEQQLWAQPSSDQPGALVFFYGTGGTAAHVGLSFGNGLMVNASSPVVGTVNSGTGGNSGFGVPPGTGSGGNSPRPPGLSPRIFDSGGWLPPGLTLVENRTGNPEHLTPDRAGQQGPGLADLAGLLSRLIRAVYDNAGMTADGVADAIGATARTSAYRAAYSPR